MDFGPTSVTPGLVGQELAVVPSQLTSSMVVDSEPGTSDMGPGVVITAAAPADVTPPVFTDDTPVSSGGIGWGGFCFSKSSATSKKFSNGDLRVCVCVSVCLCVCHLHSIPQKLLASSSSLAQ